MKTYRNIFFMHNAFTSGKGHEEVGYFGKLIPDVATMDLTVFSCTYDKDKDLLISCSACGKRKYKSITKVSESMSRNQDDSTPALKQHGSTKKPIGKRAERQSPAQALMTTVMKKCKKCGKK